MTMQTIAAGSPESHSTDIKAANIAQLKALFPELVSERIVDGKTEPVLNVDVLKQLVGDATVLDADEKYGLNWHGKRRARQIALTPSTGTLRPCPEESEDWDTTQNLMIEGDNLEVLKLLQKSYAGRVKLIYIDPPYNTGKDFVYPDNFQDNIKNYLELTGQMEGGAKLSSNTDASGRFHTDWLNMMYPRLKLAKNLLHREGVIFVSLDDNEIGNLRALMDEVFGEENFVATVIWEKADSPRNTARQFSEDHDYVLVYSGSPDWVPTKLPRTDEINSIYSNPDGDARGEWLPGDPYANKPYSKGLYKITGPTGREFSPPPGRFWRISEEKFRELDADGRIWWGPKQDARPSIKRYLTEVADLTPRTLWRKEDVGSNRTSKNEIRSLFPDDETFDTPKPTMLVERMLRLATETESCDIVLDFFAGSGTTAHAVMKLNAAENGNRRYVMVQLPEPIDAFGDGKWRSIAELTKERLRRAGAKIKADNPMFAGDTGFRVFKLDTSNIRPWDPNRDDLEGSLLENLEHILPGRTENDVLYEVLLKLGLDLCVPIEARDIAGKTVHSVGAGKLLACLDTHVKVGEVEALALGMAQWRVEQDYSGEVSAVFRDSAFENDVAKSNLAAILEQHGVKKVRSL